MNTLLDMVPECTNVKAILSGFYSHSFLSNNDMQRFSTPASMHEAIQAEAFWPTGILATRFEACLCIKAIRIIGDVEEIGNRYHIAGLHALTQG